MCSPPLEWMNRFSEYHSTPVTTSKKCSVNGVKPQVVRVSTLYGRVLLTLPWLRMASGFVLDILWQSLLAQFV